MSECNVVTLDGYDASPQAANRDVIALLEEMLERARSGNIVACAVVCRHFDKSTGAGTAGQVTHPAVIGSLYLLLNDLANQ